MDFGTAFIIAIIEGLVCWFTIKMGRNNIAALIGIVGSSMIFVPLAVITLIGYNSIAAAGGTEAMNAAASVTISNVVNWFSSNIVAVAASDCAGLFLGTFISAKV